MKIILLGYMGSGKTTVGKQFSNKMGIPFYDLDHYIATEEKATIPQIFKDKGEIYFRKIEHRYLKEFLQQKKMYILSLGGGTPCYAGNMELITNQKEIRSVYLEASISTLITRISGSKQERPLLASLSGEKITEFVAKHLFERRKFYEKAQYSISVDKKDIDTIVAEMKTQLF